MTTAQDIIATARAEIGTKEHPAGSNRQKYGATFGHDGVAWCGYFAAWCFLQHGIDLRDWCRNVGYTPTLFGDLSGRGWGVARGSILPGDLVFFDFPGAKNRIEHVGIASHPTNGQQVTSIDGNTAGPAGSQSNGGQVLERTRPLAHVAGAVRIPLAAPIIPQPSEEDDMPGYLVSDGHQIYLTDGLTKRPVPFNGQRFQELLFLGQARNSRRPDGGPEIPTLPDYLSSIPNA